MAVVEVCKVLKRAPHCANSIKSQWRRLHRSLLELALGLRVDLDSECGALLRDVPNLWGRWPMASETISRLGELYDRWKQEHEELRVFVDALTDWAADQQTEQAATLSANSALRKLRELDARLELHFSKEAELGTLLAEAKGQSAVEVESASRRAEGDHRHLGARLHALISKIEKQDFETWGDVSREISLFVDALEQHESQENESVGWLMPRAEPTEPKDGR